MRHRRRSPSSFRPRLESLEPRALLAAQVIVNEFLAANERGLVDYDDDTSDWIELTNIGDAATDLLGWYLTDDATDLTKWRFPTSTSIAPGQRILVFASGKDKIAPNNQLHTNFQLASDGEYLGLVQPNGTTIAWQIAPGYPPQANDASYGYSQPRNITELVDDVAPAGRVLVPTDNSLGTTWTQTGFADASWTPFAGGIGYATQGPVTRLPGVTFRFIDVNGGTNGSLDTASEAETIFNGTAPTGAYNLITDLTVTAPYVDFGGGNGSFTPTQAYPDGTTSDILTDIAGQVKAQVTIPSGNWSIGFGSDDGGYLRLAGVSFISSTGEAGATTAGDGEIRFEGQRGHAWTWATFTVGPAGLTTDLESMFFEHGGGDSYEIAIAAGFASTAPSPGGWSILSDGALGWGVKTNAVPPIPPYRPQVQLDLKNAMYLHQSSAYARYPFQVTDLASIDLLSLRLKYDDAFVAYLNGVEVARANISGTVAYNSTAGSDRPDAQALNFLEFDLTSRRNLLTLGTNVLAIQLLSQGPSDTGALLFPSLNAIDLLPQALAYIASPTPGGLNATEGFLGVVGRPTFSRAGGTITGTVSVTISAEAGATIRYTTDGTSPTTNSPLYSGPVAISQSTRLRAGAFRENYLPSEIRTESYVLANADLAGFSSDIPVLVFDSFGTAIAGGTGTGTYTSLALFEPGIDGRTRLSAAPTVTSRSTLEIRGSSSAGFNQKQYALELWEDGADADRKISLLGMPSESDWILQAPATFDRALMHNSFIYDLSNQLGWYAARTRYVEVYVNQNGGDLSSADYVGVYFLMEKLKRDDSRIAISKLSSQYTTEPEISGGYIFKVDRLDPGDGGFNAAGQTFGYVEPKEPEIEARPAQQAYLTNYLNGFYQALNAPDFLHPISRLHYSEWIDVNSFIDHYLLNELTLNADALRLSAYYYKPEGGKVIAGPIWDFDRALESVDGRDDNPRAWYVNIESGVPSWWYRLFQDVDFRQKFIDRWAQLRKAEYSTANINATVERLASQLTEAQGRHFARYAGEGPRTTGGFASGMLDGTWRGEVNHMKAWLQTRVEYFDTVFVNAPQFVQPGGVIPAPISISLTAPAGASIYYTIDGTDPRLPGGGISSSAQLYTGPVLVNKDRFFTARAYNAAFNSPISSFTPGDEPWSPPVQNAYTFQSPPAVHITEVHYRPPDPTTAELAINAAWTAEDFEFIEIKNTGTKSVNMLGSRFTDGVVFTFPSLTLSSGEYGVVTRNTTAFRARYGATPRVLGQFTSGALSNGGELIRLVDVLGAVIDQFTYDNSGDWPSRADGRGSSLARLNATSDPSLADNWTSSDEYGGSPGRAPTPVPFQIVINEVLTRTDSPRIDAIELLNVGATAVDMGDWYLSDSAGKLRKFRLPDDAVLPAGGLLVFDEGDFNRSLGVDEDDFALSGSQGEDLYLVSTDSAGRLTYFVSHAEFGAARNGESFGRFPEAGDELLPLLVNSLGAANGPARVGPILISEVMYQPPDPDGPDGIDPRDLEFIEIFNPSAAAVNLTDWRIRKGVDYDFPAGLMLASGGVLVVAPFDPALPANAAKLAAFRAAYSLAESVTIVGGYAGELDDAGEEVELQRPDTPPVDEPTFIPRLHEDQIAFQPIAPWPTPAAGGGGSLQRYGSGRLGIAAASWFAATPTPGSFVDQTSFQILAAETSPTGVVLHFVRDGILAGLNLYDGQDAPVDLADVELIGAARGPVAGSLIWGSDLKRIEFVPSGGPLTPDAYTLRFRSSAASITDLGGALLDGDADGAAGIDYTLNFSVAASGDRWLTLPDISRGLRQILGLSGSPGLPIRVSNAEALTRAQFVLTFDPSLLTVHNTRLATGLPADWQVTTRALRPGAIEVTASGTTALAAGEANLVVVEGTVSELATLGAAQILSLEGVLLNAGAITARGDRSVHAVAFPGDVNGGGEHSGLDASLIARVSVGLDSGFDRFGLLDPRIMGDVTGNGSLSGLDASFVARKALGLDQIEVPEIPMSPPAPPPPAAAFAPAGAVESTRRYFPAVPPAESPLAGELAAEDASQGVVAGPVAAVSLPMLESLPSAILPTPESVDHADVESSDGEPAEIDAWAISVDAIWHEAGE